jgi:hypothetical protein
MQWHCRWARRIPGVYTVKPQHARLAVSQAVARSYVLASASSVRRLATATNAMPAMMVAGFSYSASPAFAAVLHTPTASGLHVSPPALGFALLVQRLRCHHLVRPASEEKRLR